jgi:hypothetical protein
MAVTRGFGQHLVLNAFFSAPRCETSAQACTKGFYNNRDNYEDCKPCPYGMTTEGIAKGFTLASCGVAKGFGQYNGQMLPCPIGEHPVPVALTFDL